MKLFSKKNILNKNFRVSLFFRMMENKNNNYRIWFKKIQDLEKKQKKSIIISLLFLSYLFKEKYKTLKKACKLILLYLV